VNRDRYGAAVHEAGHVVVARTFGLRTRTMVAGVGGDDTAGRAEIEDASYLPVVDRIAVCAAGMQAQHMLGAATNEIAGFSDEVKIGNIVGDYDDDEGEALRDAGFSKSWETLEAHRAAVERLAAALAEHGELDHETIERIIAYAAPA
jgi:HD-GYP domain-containing protein (c-di-GMP phosphodiesterase class II)